MRKMRPGEIKQLDLYNKSIKRIRDQTQAEWFQSL